MSSNQPDAPPSYAQATGSSTASSNKLQVPQDRNGIPAQARRSMEDEQRPLPPGWVRQFDAKEQHQFFVDTKADPPRSIWHHPYDDGEYLKTLPAEERERIQEQERDRLTHLDLTDDESANPTSPRKSATRVDSSSSIPTSATAGGSSKDKPGFGRKLKNKITGTTHEERQADRARREQEERQYYEAHMRFRQALQQAQMSGQPVFLAKDRDGRDVYVEPPQSVYGGYGSGRYGSGGGYGYNPYAQGPYADPNARFIRPQGAYGRPYGPYGGGMGLPIAGGLLGGMLLGGLLF